MQLRLPAVGLARKTPNVKLPTDFFPVYYSKGVLLEAAAAGTGVGAALACLLQAFGEPPPASTIAVTKAVNARSIVNGVLGQTRCRQLLFYQHGGLSRHRPISIGNQPGAGRVGKAH